MIDEENLPHDLESAFHRLEEIINRHDRDLQARKAAGYSRNDYIRGLAVEVCELEGLQCWVVKSSVWDELDQLNQGQGQLVLTRDEVLVQPIEPVMEVGYCGYAVFPQPPLVEPGYHGIVTYVPVHGGVTYVEHDRVGSVYGFDTGHLGSEKLPIRDVQWIKAQIQLMIRGLRRAALIEPDYLRACGDNQRIAELVQPLIDMGGGELNLGTMLNLLGGDL